MRTRATTLASLLATALVIGLVPGVRADEPTDWTFEQTPPRLSFTDGQVSFWRPGAPDWTQAQINTPLAAGDALATGLPGTVEIQIGARAFVRGWGNTQLGLANQEPDFIQFRLAAGNAVFDLRTLEPGHTVEVDTPNVVITIEQTGYYRVDVSGERTRVMTRRGGQATVTPASGQTVAITPSEEVVVEGTANPQLTGYAAPPLDEWDRWNYARTDRLVDAVSARYVSPGTYGLSDLDPYGTWRVVPTYGAVWVPTGVPVGWAPYSTGSWILDPVYGWTWVDAAPWGWAPYHHGRWCFVDGYWAWAPGPLIAKAVYAPALVAFFDPSPDVVIGPGGPAVGWVALGWGEPIVPWWGRRGGGREPSWRGWGGPRVVNNVVISNTVVVNVQNITVYRNQSVSHAVRAVDRARFGHGPITAARAVQMDPRRLRPLHGSPEASTTPASFAPTTVRGIRPPEDSLRRPVVATRPARREAEAAAPSAPSGDRRMVSLPPERLVSVPKLGPRELGGGPPRPSFGHGTVERPMTDRKPSPAPPRPGAGSVGPLHPRSAVPPSPPGRQALPPPAVGKGPSASPSILPGAPPLTGPTTAPLPRISPGKGKGPEPGKAAAALPPAARIHPSPPQAAGPAPGAVRPGTSAGGTPAVTGHAGSAPGRTVRRPETAGQPAHALPGVPANRLAPRGVRQDPTKPGQPKG